MNGSGDGVSYAIFEVVSLKILKIDIRKDGTITHHVQFTKYLENTLFESKTERDILEGMLKN